MKQEKMEGSGASRLLQIFVSDTAETPLQFVSATVVSLPPEMAIRLDGESVDTPSAGLIVAEHLLDHERVISIRGGQVSGNLTGSGSLTSLAVTNATMTIKSPLEVGSRVICANASDGQLVYVMDKEGDIDGINAD